MKYLITDLDDTLLTNHKTVSPYTCLLYTSDAADE